MVTDYQIMIIMINDQLTINNDQCRTMANMPGFEAKKPYLSSATPLQLMQG